MKHTDLRSPPAPAPHHAPRRAAPPLGERIDPRIVMGLSTAVDLDSAERYTRGLAGGHYENFPVISLLLPRDLRQDFCNVYAFCRIADDLADETGSAAISLAALEWLADAIRAARQGEANTHLMIALARTIQRHDIPADPFLDLIDAFRQDQRVVRYQTVDELLDYCRRSADPVGRLVLYLCGYRDMERQRLSDRTCTALQLVNFWQDVRRDLLDRGRIYLPGDSLRRFGVDEADLREGISRGEAAPAYRELIGFEVDRARRLFEEGQGLLPLLRPAVRGHIALFGEGGMAVARAIRRQGFDTLTRRPRLSRWQKGRLVLKGLAAMMGNALHAGLGPGSSADSAPASFGPAAEVRAGGGRA